MMLVLLPVIAHGLSLYVYACRVVRDARWKTAIVVRRTEGSAGSMVRSDLAGTGKWCLMSSLVYVLLQAVIRSAKWKAVLSVPNRVASVGPTAAAHAARMKDAPRLRSRWVGAGRTVEVNDSIDSRQCRCLYLS